MNSAFEKHYTGRYQAGDTYKVQMLEFVAQHDPSGSCERCIGDKHQSICDMLPAGCGIEQINWVPNNDSAKTIQAILVLEGTL